MKTGIRILTVVAAALCWIAPAQAQLANPEARVSLRVEQRQLSEVVQYLREQSGTNIVVLRGGDTPISIDVTDVPWTEALELAAELAGCVVEERTAGVLVIENPPRVDFAFDDADITQVIDTIAKLSGANIVIAPEVAGTLSLRLTNVPWRDALDVAVKTLGYTVVVEDRGILRVVDPLSLQAQMETHSYQLRYLRPKRLFAPVIQSEFLAGNVRPGTGDVEADFPVIEALRKALSPGGELDYVVTQNVVIVRDTAQVHVSIKNVIERLDIEPGQVFVDVKFVSTTNADVHSIGVDYGDSGPVVRASGGQIPITLPFNLGQGGWEDYVIADDREIGPFAQGGNAGATQIPATIFGALSFTEVSAALRLLQRDSSTEVVQAPKIIALDGREATIFVGETIRYAEARSEQGQAGGLQLSVQEAANSPVEVGFQLLIVPHIVPGSNKLTLDVIPKETSLSGTSSSALAPQGFDVFTVGASGLEGSIALPRKRSSTIVTSMLLESGQTAVLGGLSTDSYVERTTRIPWISRIPIIGFFFKHNEENQERRNLMVFITPSVVRSSTDTQRLLQNELQQRRKEYGKRLQEILGETTALSPDSFGTDAMGESVGSDYQWSTFVQEPTTEPGMTEKPMDEPKEDSMEDSMTDEPVDEGDGR